MFALQNDILADWYTDLEERGVSYGPKPTGPGAFPTAADREALDQDMIKSTVGGMIAEPTDRDKS